MLLSGRMRKSSITTRDYNLFVGVSNKYLSALFDITTKKEAASFNAHGFLVCKFAAFLVNK
jgi:hypothetical protein